MAEELNSSVAETLLKAVSAALDKLDRAIKKIESLEKAIAKRHKKLAEIEASVSSST